MSEMKEWTLMFYFASDNPLAPGVVSQLKALKEAGFHPQANVIAQFDPHTKNISSHIFDVNLVNKLEAGNKPKVGFKSNDPFVRNLVFDKLWLEKDADIRRRVGESLNRRNGRNIDYDPPAPPDDTDIEIDPVTALKSFLKFCRKHYPARHYMLFILGHGLVVGNDLFLFDENAPEPRITIPSDSPGLNISKQRTLNQTTEENVAQHSLLLRHLGEVLKGFKDSIGDSTLELVGFHSCSMSGLEVAYEIKDYANFMLGSQGPAFVGSWPYRQILIRVFNDLNSQMFRAGDLLDVDSLIARLKQRTDPVSAKLYLRLTEATKKLLGEQNDTRLHHRKLFDALLKELNNLLYDADPKKHAWVKYLELSPATRQLKEEQLHGMDRIRLNRMLLQDAFKSEIKKKRQRRQDLEKKDLKDRLIKIFNYCMFNSYDFQLAGYSYDMSLCDLSKLRDERDVIRKNVITDALKTLSSALREGLKDKHTRKLILMAHMESQSYWQEQYTDLYDFCFRFMEAFDEAYTESDTTLPYANQDSRAIPQEIRNACEEVKTLLRRGVRSLDDELIVRCEYVGPTYQYSHGLSVFFPWCRPVDDFFSKQYMKYAFSETEWYKFLDEYFTATMRDLAINEVDMTERLRGETFNPDNADLDRSSISERSVVEGIAGTIFNSGGQLSKGGSGDRTGGDCECPSIKNYPSFKATDTTQDYEKDKSFPVSPRFRFRQVR